MNSELLIRLHALLGRAVLLPVPAQQKGCKLKGWSRTTWEQTQQAEYGKRLLDSGNVGVLLGTASDHLVSVDCDSDDALREFLEINPTLKSTLITKGARGGNVWLRMAGDYPQQTTKLGPRGTWGEFRSGGGMTIIAGTHPNGKAYTIVNEAQPLLVSYNSIRWPVSASEPRIRKPEAKSADSSSESLHTAPLHPCALHPASLHNTPLVSQASRPIEAHRTAAAIRAFQVFERTHPVLAKITDSICSPFLPLEVGNRNTVLTHEISPRLFSAVGRTAAQRIVEFLIASDQVGGYPPEEAREKFFHVYDALATGYADTLPGDEKAIFEALDDVYHEAFRIVRALAFFDHPDYPPPRFFISAGAFGCRLSIADMAAWRILRRFKKWGILTPLHCGTRRAVGQPGKAAEYAWPFTVPV
jgi:hypothetical protein